MRKPARGGGIPRTAGGIPHRCRTIRSVKSARPQKTGAVLIAPVEWLGALQQQHGLAGAEAFLDTDVATALERVIRQQPRVIAMEADFAASPDGVAFLSRVQSELELGTYEVRLIRTRQAPRFTPARGIEVVVDGHSATLIDISVKGAQMIATFALEAKSARQDLPEHQTAGAFQRQRRLGGLRTGARRTALSCRDCLQGRRSGDGDAVHRIDARIIPIGGVRPQPDTPMLSRASDVRPPR